MWIIELSCAAIVLLYVGVRARADEAPARFLRRLALLSVAGFLGEETMMEAYGFYAYSPDWSVFLHRVPLMIALIWPVVIHSAWDLARRLLGDGEHRVAMPLLVGAIVLADASLIEPIAVEAGLWRWTEPGLFSVPPVGILGWAFFAAWAVGWLSFVDRGARPAALEAGVLVLPGLLTHASVVAAWWALFRWVNVSVPPWPVVAAVWGVAVAVAWRVASRRLATRVPARDMLLRVPGAVFFFVLLALHGADVPALVAYACAFAPPYLALTDWASLRAPRQALDGSG